MRRSVFMLTLLLTASSLAGCLGDDVDEVGGEEADIVDEVTTWVVSATGEVLDPSAYPGELADFDIVHITDRISAEPTIGVTPDGTIFYAAIDFDLEVDLGEAGGSTLPTTDYLRSLDGGATWETTNPQMGGVETHPMTFDPYVYVDPTTGRVFAMDMGPHVACNKVSWSDDDGESWITREGACIPGVNDHPSLFAGPATPITNTVVYPNHLYLCTNQVTDTLCYHSPDGGINWIAGEPTHIGYDPNRASQPEISTDPEAVLESAVEGAVDGLCGGLAGHGHASWATGTVFLGRTYCGDVTVALSRDGGLTWSVKTIATQDPFRGTRDHDVSVATDAAGNVYAFWVGNQGRSVYLATSTDDGDSWSQPMNVTAPGVTAVKLPSLVAGDEGRISFLYIGSDNPYGHRVGARYNEEQAKEAGRDDCEFGDQDDLRVNELAEEVVEDIHVHGLEDNNHAKPCYRYPEALANATWHAYVGMSLNALDEEPVFATDLADNKTHPLKRGSCSGRCPGNGAEGGFYDFLDIEIDPKTGQVYLALVDICTEDCDGEGEGHDGINAPNRSKGSVGRQISGTTLRAVEATPAIAEVATS